MSKALLCNTRRVKEGQTDDVDVLIDGERTAKVPSTIDATIVNGELVNCDGNLSEIVAGQRLGFQWAS